jgi:hypothetical protein
MLQPQNLANGASESWPPTVLATPFSQCCSHSCTDDALRRLLPHSSRMPNCVRLSAAIGQALHRTPRASSNDPGWMSDELRSLPPLGRSRGAAMTWRLATPVAQPGWFIAGDAAAVLDPTCSGCVLKAIMSGMMAAHLGAPVIAGSVPADAAAEAYGNWVADWFALDATRLAQFYRGLGVAGFGRPSHPARHRHGDERC